MTETPPCDDIDDRNETMSTVTDGSGKIDSDEINEEFLSERDPEDYPAVLRLTSDSEQTHREDALDRVDRWEAGEEVPHVINFQNPSDLRALLTDRRVELLHTVMTDAPASIRELADRVDRDVKSVHNDLAVLTEYNIVHFNQSGRAKQPFVPYETIEVSLEISPTNPADDTAAV